MFILRNILILHLVLTTDDRQEDGKSSCFGSLEQDAACTGENVGREGCTFGSQSVIIHRPRKIPFNDSKPRLNDRMVLKNELSALKFYLSAMLVR